MIIFAESFQDKSMSAHHLSQAQMEIYYACQSHPGNVAYNLPQVFPLSKNVDTDRLASALRTIWEQRETLHTLIYKDENGSPLQRADISMPLPLSVRQLQESEAGHYITDAFIRPFDFTNGEPLVRFEIVITEKHHYLLVDIHHIIADGHTISECLVHQDIPDAYEGKPLRESLLSLYEFADAEQSQTGNEDYEKSKEFFLHHLSGVSFTRLSHPTASPQGRRIHSTASVDSHEVNRWCDEHQVSQNLLFNAAFAIVLSRMSGTQYVVYATLNHGRTDRRLANSYGMFVKTTPVLADCKGEKTVTEFLHDLHSWQFSAARHRHYPFTHLCQDLRQTPAATFAFQGTSIQEYMRLEGETVYSHQPVTGETVNDLSCIVYRYGTVYEIRTEASERLISQTLLTSIARATVTCAKGMMADMERPLKSIPLINQEESADLIRIGTGETLSFDAGQTFVSLFLRQAGRTPDRIAVSDGTRSLTYRELNQRTSSLAMRLQEEGLVPGDNVIITAGQTIEFLVGAIAVERSGAAYVAVDPTWPASRIEEILDDSHAKLVCDGKTSTAAPKPSAENHATPEGIAYIVYTSGTTGKPKGVKISHRAKLNFIQSIVHLWGLDADARISCHSSVAFDAAVEDLFPALTVGAAVYIIPDQIRHDIPQLHRFITEHKITGGCFTTQFGLMLLQYQDPHMHYICLGGEKLNVNPQTTTPVVNTYGPTEFTVDATYHWLQPGKAYSDIPIGRPLPNQQAVILDLYGHILPKGAVGELCLSGSQRFSGYQNQEEPAVKLYHTGDLCRWNDEDELEYIGRADRQLKIRGYRVEPESIESTLLSSGLIEQTCVESTPDRRQLIAYFTDKDPQHPVPEADIRKWLIRQLPIYMMPSRFIRLQQLPLTSTGKIDHDALPCPENKRKTTGLPTSGTTMKWCELFGNTLSLPDVYPDDNFFELGGTSLLAISLQIDAAKEGLHINYTDIFEHPTPEQLATLTSDRAKAKEPQGDDIATFDYTGIHQYLNTQDMAAGLEKPRSHDGMTLITGATGFLGIHILREYLQRQQGDVVCLVRRKEGKDGIQRLDEAYSYYFGEHSLRASVNRLHIVEQDLLSIQSTDIPYPVGTIIHCAADIRHQDAGKEIEHTNIDGTLRIIETAKEKQARLIHISTISVGGTGGKEPLTERNLYVGQSLPNPYVRSKFIAERAVLQAAANHEIDAMVVRVGNLAPRRTDGLFRRDDVSGMEGAIQGIKMLGCYPESLSHIPFDRTPVDETAAAIVSNVLGKEHPRILMPFNPDMLTLHDIFLDTDIKQVSDQEFEQTLHNALTDNEKHETFLQLLNLYAQVEKIVES